MKTNYGVLADRRILRDAHRAPGQAQELRSLLYTQLDQAGEDLMALKDVRY